MTWANHCVPPKGIVMYELNCRKLKSGKYKFDVSVRKDGDIFKVYMPKHSAGAPLLLRYDSLEKVNKFLKAAGLEALTILKS